MAQMVKNPSVIQDIWIWSQGKKDTLEEEMANHSGILAWEIPQTEETGGYSPGRSQQVGHDWATEHACMSNILQPMDNWSGLCQNKQLEH